MFLRIIGYLLSALGLTNTDKTHADPRMWVAPANVVSPVNILSLVHPEETSLLSVRFLDPLTQVAPDSNLYETFIVDTRTRITKLLRLDIENKRMYLYAGNKPTALDAVRILPDDPDDWDEYIYNEIFPAYAI